MISAIEIENFKCVGDRVRVEFAPITLLFGPNSAGKSTIIQALLYAHEIFSRGNLDAGETLKGGRAIDLGGFKNFVHQRDDRRKVRIRIHLPDSGVIDPPGTSLDELEEDIELLENYWEIQAGGYTVGLELTWSEVLQAPVVTSYTVEAGGIWVGRIETTLDSRQSSITALNWNHPNFRYQGDELAERLDELNARRVSENLNPLMLIDSGVPNPLAKRGKETMFVLFDGDKPVKSDEPGLTSLSEFFAWFQESFKNTNANEDGSLTLPVRLDGPGISLSFDASGVDHRFLSDPDSLNPYEQAWSVDLCLRDIFFGSAWHIRHHLNRLLYLGPLRDVPQRGYQPPRRFDPERWPSGLAAWDRVFDEPEDQIAVVNSYLSESSKLDTGYGIRRITLRQLTDQSLTVSALRAGGVLDQIEAVETEIRGLPTETSVRFIEEATQIELAPHDLGIGMSQVFPVVVAAVAERNAITCIEQPELHVHPRVQVNLGDLFISQISDLDDLDFHARQFILETHSEHLLLRLLRRVRETTAGELPPGVKGLRPDQLSINYIESTDTGMRVRQLEVTSDGDFSGDWPRGFFQERAEELF